MKGLIYNNLITVLKSRTVQILAILFGFYLVLGFLGGGINMGFVFMYIMGALSISFFGITSDNENLSWNSFEVSLPLTRKKIVLCKFISVLILIVIGFIVAELYGIITYFLFNREMISFKFAIGMDLSINAFVFFTSLIWIDIISPFIMKFGMVIGKIFAMACIFAMVYISYTVSSGELFVIDIGYPAFLGKYGLYIMFAAIAFITSAISYFICCKIYEKKDF